MLFPSIRSPGPKMHSEAPGRVAGGGPTRTAVESKALIPDDLDEATGAEGVGVRSARRRGGSGCFPLEGGGRSLNTLPHDLEDVKGEENDLSNSGEA